MRRTVVWSPTAKDDLLAITRYIARDDPGDARTVAAALRAAGEALGNASTGRPGRGRGTYEKSVLRLPYVNAYEVMALGEAEAVAILHVIHTARDWLPGEWPA